MTSMKENTLYLVWQKEDGTKVKLGKLWNQEKKYYFMYIQEEAKKAMEQGFKLLENFPSVEVSYFREEMFMTFKPLKKNSGENEFDILEGTEVRKDLFLEK